MIQVLKTVGASVLAWVGGRDFAQSRFDRAAQARQLDRLAVPGRSFQYTESGPEGLLGGRKLVVFAARGGKYLGTPADTQTGHVRTFFNFIGIDDIEFVYAEGLNMGDDTRRRALDAANAQIERLAA